MLIMFLPELVSAIVSSCAGVYPPSKPRPVDFTDRPAHKGYPGRTQDDLSAVLAARKPRRTVTPSVPFGLLGIGQKFVTPSGGPVWRKLSEVQAGGVAAMPGEFPSFFGWSSQVVPVEDE